MSSVSDNISVLLDHDKMEDDIPVVSEVVDSIVPTNNQIDIDTDVEFARDNIKALIKKGSDALDSILVVAKESQQPRAFEVVATLLKNMSDMNKDLLELQKRKKDLAPTDFSKQNINVDKAVVFTGSTTELVKLIKKSMED